MNIKLKSKVNVFNPDENNVIYKGEVEDRFECPYCPKGDTEAKFHWNKIKQVGHCFKCESIGVLKGGDSLNRKFTATLNSLKSTIENKISTPTFNVSEVPFETMFDALNDESKKYFYKRCPIYQYCYDLLNLRTYKNDGIVFPIFIDNIIVSYVIRYYNPVNGVKYYSPPGLKLLYSPNNILNRNNNTIEITLVEGVFDAISSLFDGYKNPIAILGKTLTDTQIYFLRKQTPVKINICMDKTSISWDLYHKIKSKFPTCGEIKVIPIPDGFDPEERLNFNLTKTDKKSIKDTIDRVNNGVKYLTK